MTVKVKELIDTRVAELNDTIEWFESDLKCINVNLEATQNRIAEARSEREELQAYADKHFTKDVVLEQLQKTREVLEERGRGTGALISAMTGKVCLLGAVGIAVAGEDFRSGYAGDGYGVFTSGEPGFDVVAGLAEQIVALKKNPRIPPVISATPAETVYRFNDRGATDEDVFEVIDRAIEARKAAA